MPSFSPISSHGGTAFLRGQKPFRIWIGRSAALILFIVMSCAGFGAPPLALSSDDNRAYEKIATTKRFCSDAVGEDGETPEVVVALRALLKSPQADAVFKQLLLDATTAGKLYALCGVYYTDPSFFEKVVQGFRQSSEEVQTFMGCDISHATVGAIVESSSLSVVRLKSRSQTIKQWATEVKPKGMTFDIVGGGWPDSL
jgi:hypothetical protein